MSNTTILKIEGMTCGHCVRGVTQALTSVDGVQTATVDLASGRAHVVHDGAVALRALTHAVAEEGYTAEEGR